LIAVTNLTKRYGGPEGLLALDDISLSVNDGEFVSIVGPSGCGKSTLLKIVAGLLRHSKGSIALGGSPIREPSRDVGVVFQAPVLLPWRTILENVLFPLEIRTGQPQKYRDRAMDLLEMAGLRGFDGRYSLEINDFTTLYQGNCTPRDYTDAIKAQFDRLYAEGADNGQVMCLPLHPFLIGQAHRMKQFEEALDYITSHDKVWLATGREIADHYYQHSYDAFASAIAARKGA